MDTREVRIHLSEQAYRQAHAVADHYGVDLTELTMLALIEFVSKRALSSDHVTHLSGSGELIVPLEGDESWLGTEGDQA